MNTLAWLHLSDWHHQKRVSRDRRRVRKMLIRDIQNRTAISDTLGKIDFILFSGDISSTGAKEEFAEVKTELIDPIRNAIGKDTPIFCVPGNHDIERGRILEISTDLRKQIAQITGDRKWQEFNEIASEPATAAELNKPLTNYFEFLATLTGTDEDQSKLYSVKKIKKNGTDIGILCINTAWNSARYLIQHAQADSATGVDPWHSDYGLLRITEAQLQDAIDELGNSSLVILMMHHPLHWIEELERAKLEQLLFDHCHIVIHGHEHRPNTSRISSAFGDLVFIPAGATYVGQSPDDPRYSNAYNFTMMEVADDHFSGTVYHRIWSEEHRKWQSDERYWLNGRSQFVIAKDKEYDRKLAHVCITKSSRNYIRFVGNRAALEHELIVRHDDATVGGQKFIHQHIKVRLKLRAGPPEKFRWQTTVDDMIVRHPNKLVQKRAYELLNISPKLTEVVVDEEVKRSHNWEGMVSEREQWLEYEYKVLDLPSNFFYFMVRRFTDRVKLTIQEAKGYTYDYLPIGGFPLLKPRRDLLSVDTIETDEMILPSQGYIIQWRPQHKPKHKISKAPATRGKRSKR